MRVPQGDLNPVSKRRPIIDEHDFYAGRYLSDEENPVEIKVVFLRKRGTLDQREVH